MFRLPTTTASLVRRAITTSIAPLRNAVTPSRMMGAVRPFTYSSTRLSQTTSTPATPPSTPSTSFITHAQQHGAASLIGPFIHGDRFDSCLTNMVITKMDPSGEVEATLTVNSKVENSYGSLHGGAISTLVDVIGTLALLAKDHKRGGVSVDLNVNFLAALKVGTKVTCKGRVLKLGRTLGFTQVELYTPEGQLAAIGRHTKAM